MKMGLELRMNPQSSKLFEAIRSSKNFIRSSKNPALKKGGIEPFEVPKFSKLRMKCPELRIWNLELRIFEVPTPYARHCSLEHFILRPKLWVMSVLISVL